MADTKISALPAVTDVLATDEYVLARSSVSKKITAADLLAGTGGGGELAYAEVTTNVNVSGTTEASPTDVVSLGAVTYAAVPTVLEFYCGNVDASTGAAIIFCLWDASTELCRWADYRPPSNQSAPVYAFIRITPSAGSHTYRVRAFKTAGTVTLAGGTGSGGSATYAPISMRAQL